VHITQVCNIGIYTQWHLLNIIVLITLLATVWTWTVTKSAVLPLRRSLCSVFDQPSINFLLLLLLLYSSRFVCLSVCLSVCHDRSLLKMSWISCRKISWTVGFWVRSSHLHLRGWPGSFPGLGFCLLLMYGYSLTYKNWILPLDSGDHPTLT